MKSLPVFSFWRLLFPNQVISKQATAVGASHVLVCLCWCFDTGHRNSAVSRPLTSWYNHQLPRPGSGSLPVLSECPPGQRFPCSVRFGWSKQLGEHGANFSQHQYCCCLIFFAQRSEFLRITFASLAKPDRSFEGTVPGPLGRHTLTVQALEVLYKTRGYCVLAVVLLLAATSARIRMQCKGGDYNREKLREKPS